MQHSNLTALAALKKLRTNNNQQKPAPAPSGKIPDHFLVIQNNGEK